VGRLHIVEEAACWEDSHELYCQYNSDNVLGFSGYASGLSSGEPRFDPVYHRHDWVVIVTELADQAEVSLNKPVLNQSYTMHLDRPICFNPSV